MSYEDLLRDVLEETGADINVTKDELIQYTAARAVHLTTLIGQPGYHLALRAERDAVALYAGLNATMAAEAADSRIVGVIQSVLMGLAGAV